MHRRLIQTTSAATLLALAGFAHSIAAQQSQPTRPTDPNQPGSNQNQNQNQQPGSNQNQQPGSNQYQQPGSQPGMQSGAQSGMQSTDMNSRMNRAADYRSCHWLTGRDVANSSDETIGEVSDMVVDRGSGRVTHVVVKTGTTLGMGGRAVLIPYNEFQWQASRERLMLNTSAENLSSYPNFTANDWRGLRESTPPQTNLYGPGDRAATNNPDTYSPSAGANQPGVSRSGDNRTGTDRTGTDRTGTDRSGTGQSGTGQSGTGQSGTGQSGSGTGQSGQSGTGQSGTGGTGQSGTGQSGTGQSGTGQSGTGQGGSGMGQSGQSGTSGTGQTGDRRSGIGENQDRRSGIGSTQDRRSGISDQQGRRGTGQAESLNEWMWSRSSNTTENYGQQWDMSLKQRIDGEIKRVERSYSPHYGEQIIVEVAAQDGTTKKIAMGPSWYLSGGETPLMRGERISVDVVPINIATSATINGREITLRNTDGSAAWGGSSFKQGTSSYSAPYYRSALVSEIRGAQLDCRGTTCGRVDDVIIDVSNGSVAFLSIDPNQNFMGIADTKRLVPWGVATIAMDGRVRIDANKDMVAASMKTPTDLKSLSSAGAADSIYNAYQIQPPSRDAWQDDSSSWNQRRRRDWTDVDPDRRDGSSPR